MNSPKNSSGRRTPGRVATAPPPKAASKSEAAYLKEQAANAHTAFKQTLAEIAGGLGKGVSPKEWTQAHPWVMLSATAVAGFTAACAAVPSKDQAELRRLARLEKALRAEQRAAETSDKSDDAHTNGHGKPKKSLTAILVAELLHLGTTVITSLIRAGMTAPKPPEPDFPGDRATYTDPPTS